MILVCNQPLSCNSAYYPHWDESSTGHKAIAVLLAGKVTIALHSTGHASPTLVYPPVRLLANKDTTTLSTLLYVVRHFMWYAVYGQLCKYDLF